MSSVWTSMTLLMFLLLVISLQFWGLRLFGDSIDYTKAASWGQVIAAIAASIAVVVAVGAMLSEKGRYLEDLERLRRKELTQVYAWLDPRRGDVGQRVWLLSFENGTKVPVYDWTVELGKPVNLIVSSATHGPIRPGSSSLSSRKETNYSSCGVMV